MAKRKDLDIYVSVMILGNEGSEVSLRPARVSYCAGSRRCVTDEQDVGCGKSQRFVRCINFDNWLIMKIII